jgi:DinB superfamily
MKTKSFVVVCSLALATVAIAAQQGPPPTLVAEVQTMFNALKNNITRSAEQFPEDKYDWSPTPDVRTWGGLLSHIADDNNGACFALAGDAQRPPSLDSGGKPTEAGKGLKKADINRLLAESFARCDKAFAAVAPETMMERQGSRSRIGALIYDTQHISEHYGNIVTYMRLQGMVPPSSAGRGRGGN